MFRLQGHLTLENHGYTTVVLIYWGIKRLLFMIVEESKLRLLSNIHPLQ